MEIEDIRLGIYVIDVFDPNNPIERQIDLDDLVLIGNYRHHHLPFKPLPLTEQHLKEFGFTFSSEWYGKDFYLHQTFSIDDEFLGSEYFEIGLNKEDYNSIHSFFHENSTMEYKYLHELQNLHFALHGRDLVRNKS